MPRALLAAVLLAILASAALRGQSHKLTLTGKLFGVGDIDDCTFSTDPDGDSESIGLQPIPGGVACRWLMGTNARTVVVTIEVQP